MSNTKSTTSVNKFDQLSDTMSITDNKDDDLLDEILEDVVKETASSSNMEEESKEVDVKEEDQKENWVQVVNANGNGKNKQKPANTRDRFANFTEIQLCKVLGEIKIKSYRASRPGQTRVLKYLKNDLFELAFIVCALSNELNQINNDKTVWPRKLKQALESDKWFAEFKNYFIKKNPKYLCRSELLVRDLLLK